MPNCRVLKDLRSKPLEITKDADAKMKEKVITLEDIRVCLQNGDVDFSKSNKPEGNGKLYVIEGFTTKNEAITVEMINQSEKVILKTISEQ